MIEATKHRLKPMLKHVVERSIVPRQPSRVDLPLSRWDLEIGTGGTLWLRDQPLSSLAKAFGTPLHVVDAISLERVARDSRTPAADVYYSYKTNPVPEVLRILHATGIGAEVISPYELWLAFELGVPAERIIYNGPAKSLASLEAAIDAGICLINANSAGEVERISSVAAKLGKRANLGIRVALPGMWGDQFGISASSGLVPGLVNAALDDSNLTLTGLHFHRGGTMRSSAEWSSYVQSVLSFCDDLRNQTGWYPDVLDLGGSLACPTTRSIPQRQMRLNRAFGCDLIPPDPSDAVTVQEAAAMAAALVREHVGPARTPPRLVLEPGRALTSTTQMLLTAVVDVKTDSTPWCAVMDAGMNVASPMPYEYHQLFSVNAPGAPHHHPYRVVGPICTPADTLYYDWRLPELEIGHVLAVMDTGAYFVPFSTSFSFPRPSIAVVERDGARLARRRESFDDVVGLDGIAGHREAAT